MRLARQRIEVSIETLTLEIRRSQNNIIKLPSVRYKLAFVQRRVWPPITSTIRSWNHEISRETDENVARSWWRKILKEIANPISVNSCYLECKRMKFNLIIVQNAWLPPFPMDNQGRKIRYNKLRKFREIWFGTFRAHLPCFDFSLGVVEVAYSVLLEAFSSLIERLACLNCYGMISSNWVSHTILFLPKFISCVRGLLLLLIFELRVPIYF